MTSLIIAIIFAIVLPYIISFVCHVAPDRSIAKTPTIVLLVIACFIAWGCALQLAVDIGFVSFV